MVDDLQRKKMKKIHNFRRYLLTILSLVQILPYTRHVTDAGLAKETDLYFMAVVERGTGTVSN